jgi:hypothetical protein
MFGGRRSGRWAAVVWAAVGVLIANLTAVAINSATSVQSRWPAGLELVRAHPFRFSALITVLALVFATIQTLRLDNRGNNREDLLPPVPPEPPGWVVSRPAEVAQVVRGLCSTDGQAVGITTALHGAGGFGKTTLASIVCAEKRIRQRFGRRIYHVTLGRDVRSAEAIAGRVCELALSAAMAPISPTRASPDDT